MSLKKICLNLLLIIGVSFCCTGCLFAPKKEISKDIKNSPQNEIKKTTNNNIQEVKHIKSYDLYESTPYEIPLLAVIEISKLEPKIKKIVDNLLESAQGFYYLKKNDNGVFIILQHSVNEIDTFLRHDLQFVEISNTGEISYYSAGYSGIDGEIYSLDSNNSDKWEFFEEQEVVKPLKHIVYNENGKEKFTELWNYEDNEPIKYMMKDGHNKTLSVLKFSQENDSNLRKEHIFYDNEGNTKMSLTINYDGANISRLNFYNEHDLVDSVMVLTEYENGVKTKELIYNKDFELIYTVISSYEDNIRKKIVLYDKEGKDICKITN